MRGLIAGLVLGAALAAPALAEIPAQAEWNDARQTVTLPGGLTLAYVEMGAEAGRPLVMVHGYSDNSRSWSLLAPHLGDRRMIAVDLRGHGASDAPDCCYGLDSLSDDLIGFIEALDLGTVDLIGHSLGSMTAAVTAALRPDLVNRVVLVSSALDTPAAASDWLWENVPALPDPIDPESQFMLDWYWNPNPVDEDFLTRERTESAAMPRQAWMGVLTGLTLADWSLLAARIEAPVLLLWGDQDGLFGADEQEALRAALPEAEFIGYEGYGHNMFWETPEEVGAAVRDFLAD
ncbi:alpha/beta hydrolase [Pararhodobacter sp. SW119]|uniref:alpha/beta fold hydrolase n=1 Tax=Pararhodobacter sp. SW119 TaxID=2780075 RepID=UPI001ADFDBAC|nr:alpha/beta hydrolase [Pararhodobacter sp. SW119]